MYHTHRTLQWVINDVKGYLNVRWRLVTTIDLRLKSCMCCILEIKRGLNEELCCRFILTKFNIQHSLDH